MDIEPIQLPVTDAEGQPLATGDRVQVTGSDRYGEPTGVVVGFERRINTTEVCTIDADGQVVNEVIDETGEKPIRIRVMLDDGQDDNYLPSQGRVTKIMDHADTPAA